MASGKLATKYGKLFADDMKILNTGLKNIRALRREVAKAEK